LTQSVVSVADRVPSLTNSPHIKIGRVGIQCYHSNHTVLPWTQLNKEQFTTAKVLVEKSWKANGATPHLGRVGRTSWRWGEVTGYPLKIS